MKSLSLMIVLAVAFLSSSCSRFHEVESLAIDEDTEIVFRGDNYWDCSCPIHFVILRGGEAVLTSKTVAWYVPGSQNKPKFKVYRDQTESAIGIASASTPLDLVAIVDATYWIDYNSRHDASKDEIDAIVALLHVNHPDLQGFP